MASKTKENKSVSVTIGKGSWLNNCKLANLDDGVVSWTDFDIPDLPERDGDIEYRVEGHERPETLAKKFYGNYDLWWVIAVANDIQVPLVEMYPGRLLRIPEPSYVLNKINSRDGI